MVALPLPYMIPRRPLVSVLIKYVVSSQQVNTKLEGDIGYGWVTTAQVGLYLGEGHSALSPTSTRDQTLYVLVPYMVQGTPLSAGAGYRLSKESTQSASHKQV